MQENNALVNAAYLGHLMGVIDPNVPAFGIIDKVADCALKLSQLEEKSGDPWRNAEVLVNCWDTVCYQLARRLNKMAYDHDKGKQVKNITKKEIARLMP